MACRILFHQKKADLAFYKLKPSVSLKPSDPTKCFSTSPIWNTWLSTKWLLENTDPKRHHFSTQSGGATPIFFTTWGPKTHFVQGGQPTTKGSGNANLHGIIGFQHAVPLYNLQTQITPWKWASVLLQVANEHIQYAASIQEVGPSLDNAWHWMEHTKCGKLVPQEWDLPQNAGEAWRAWAKGAQTL